MLIYEVTLPSEYIGGLAKKAGTGLVKGGQALGQNLVKGGQALGQKISQSQIGQDIKTIGSTIGSKSALSNIGKGFVQGFAGVDFPRHIDSIEKVTRDRARQLALQWKKLITSQKKQQPATAAQVKPSATDPNWRQDALKSAGATFGQAPAQRPAPGQMPASVAASAQGQKMMQAYGTPKGGVQGIKEAPQEYTTPSGVIVPGASPAVPVVDFESWADQQLTTQVSGTGQHIDLDAVKRDPAVKAELDKVLPQIKKDPGNIAAVEMYFLTAMQGMQRLAAQARQNAGVGSKAPSTNPLGKIINDQQLTAIKNLAQNPQTASALKQALGIK